MPRAKKSRNTAIFFKKRTIMFCILRMDSLQSGARRSRRWSQVLLDELYKMHYSHSVGEGVWVSLGWASDSLEVAHPHPHPHYANSAFCRARRVELGSIDESVWLHSGANPFTKYRIRVPRYPTSFFSVIYVPTSKMNVRCSMPWSRFQLWWEFQL